MGASMEPASGEGGRGADGAGSASGGGGTAAAGGGSSPGSPERAAASEKCDLGGGSPTTCAPSDSEGEAAGAETEDSEEEDYGHRFKPDETVLIFDWDDTMLPSSWVQDRGLRLDSAAPPEQRPQLRALARHVSETLRLAKQLGTVVLVTNAERGWIELSCARFLPAVGPVLESIKLLSARSEYERLGLVSPFEWKLRAFGSEIGRTFASDSGGRRKKNVLSVGDSAHEREAVLRVTSCMPNCRTKSLKFVEKPSIDQLCRQHQLIARCLRRLVHHDGNLDLNISAS